MCVIHQSEIKIAYADMIVYKYIKPNKYPPCYDGSNKSINCLNLFHRTTDPVTGRVIEMPCTTSYSNKAIGFEEGAGYTCFVDKPTNIFKYGSYITTFIIKKGTRYKTGIIPPGNEFANMEVIQAETLHEPNIEINTQDQ